MEIKTIKILLVEDNPDDVFFLHAVLDRVTGTHFNSKSPAISATPGKC